MYNTHTFIHYFNYDALQAELIYIQSNINLLANAYKKFSSLNSTINIVLIDLSVKNLQDTYDQVYYKYKNLNPANRYKRGLLNAVGTLYKAFFRLLDSQDGERIDQAITALDKNQRNIYNSLNRQMSLSNQIIDRLNNSLTTISINQRSITNHINAIQNNMDNLVITSLKMLTLKEVKRQIATDCIKITETLEEVENAIMFAKLYIIHPSIIHTAEILEMLYILQTHYSESNVIKCKVLLSYYELLTALVYFSPGKMIFAIHFPVITNVNYMMYEIIPIPQRNLLFYPTTFLTIRALDIEEQFMMDRPCQEIESTYYCTSDCKPADRCMKSTLNSQQPDQCTTRTIDLKVTMTQSITNNLIVIPKEDESMNIVCQSREEYKQLTMPLDMNYKK